MKSEAYWDIVWRQFKKNRFALVSLWLLGPLFLMAIFAPALASSRPFIFSNGEETLYPWFRALFNTAEPVDFVFNMALIGFFPWVILALAANWGWKKKEVPGRRRVLRVAGIYLAIIAALTIAFSFDALSPTNKYFSRSFPEEQFRSGGKVRALYTPIPLGPREQDTHSLFKPPMYTKERQQWKDANDGFPHVLGTDNVGRDVLVRMIHGTRVALTVGFVAVSIYLTIGVIIGAVAGYFGGIVDITICRIIETVMLFPSFFLILTLVAMIGPSIYMIMVVIGFTGWTGIARLTRGEVLRQRSGDYVTAARALGASHTRVIFRHILPNALSPALVSAPFGIAGAIITEAGLSLLGFGVQPPAPTWGDLLNIGNSNYAYWWLIVFPSIAIFFTVTVFNLIGSGLRDAMDPRLRM